MSGETVRAALADSDHALVAGAILRLRNEFDLRADEADLRSAGLLGLVEARNRFDASRGVQFSTFATYRIRGAILDWVRRNGHVPRRIYAQMMAADRMDLVAEAAGEARASAPEERTDVAATVRAIDDTLHKLTAAFVLECVGQEESATSTDAEGALIERETAQRVRAALDSLDDRGRALIVGFYFEGRQFDQVAAELGISKSWASRIHGKALDTLRRKLADLA